MKKRVLVSVDHANGTAAMLRDRHGVWLTGAMHHGGATLANDERPCSEGVGEQRTAIGGRLPRDAVRTVVVNSSGREHEAAVGNGAWIAVLDEPLGRTAPAVRYHASDGGIVPTRLPADWPRAPIHDAITPCPACAAIEWDAVQARGESWGGSYDSHGRFTPDTIAACRLCGHEENVGTFFGIGLEGEDEDDPDAGMRTAAWEAERRMDETRLLAATRFPLYVLAGGPPPCAHGFGGRISNLDADLEQPNRVTVAHGDVDAPSCLVQTSLDCEGQSPEELARDAIRSVIDGGDEQWPDLSEPALHLWLDERKRSLNRTLLDGRESLETIDVDGAPRSFACLSLDHHWAAAAHIGGLTVTIAARDIAALSATRLASVPATTISPGC